MSHFKDNDEYIAWLTGKTTEKYVPECDISEAGLNEWADVLMYQIRMDCRNAIVKLRRDEEFWRMLNMGVLLYSPYEPNHIDLISKISKIKDPYLRAKRAQFELQKTLNGISIDSSIDYWRQKLRKL